MKRSGKPNEPVPPAGAIVLTDPVATTPPGHEMDHRPPGNCPAGYQTSTHNYSYRGSVRIATRGQCSVFIVAATPTETPAKPARSSSTWAVRWSLPPSDEVV